MTLYSVDNLDKDYRNFDLNNLPYTLSQRILDPYLLIEVKKGKYKASLGATVRKKDSKAFIACHSVFHNWILDNNIIRVLPFDTPDIINEFLDDALSDNLKYSIVLSIMRDGIEGVEIEVAPEVFEKANVRALSSELPCDIPDLNATLYPYQQNGVAWMYEALNSIGGLILADEMGLGKTMQIIALFLLSKLSNDSPALIICPTTLIANWYSELAKFAPSLTVIVHRGADRTGFYKNLMRSQIVISTYDTLVNDISMFRDIEWKYLVCDEAQAAKNPDSKRRIALGQLQRTYSIPVTGTPMENSLMDLWSLGDLAIPGILGSKDNFMNYYPDTESGAIELSTVTDTFILKRQVKDVANDLPDRTDIDLPVDLDDEAIDEYERIKREAIENYGPAGKLVAVGQLAIYCAHPWLRIKNPDKSDWEDNVELRQTPSVPLMTPKMIVCLNLLREALFMGKKVLIFATYNHCGEIIRNAVTKEKLPDAYWNAINGSTPQVDRQNIVDEFSDCAGPAVLVLNPRAAGAGLNITAATIVIHFTQNWNPALEMQASARAHRRGQSQPVSIYRIYYKGTVEETMVERSQWKRELGELAVPVSIRESDDLDKALSIAPPKDEYNE